jgi:hypothetical protein
MAGAESPVSSESSCNFYLFHCEPFVFSNSFSKRPVCQLFLPLYLALVEVDSSELSTGFEEVEAFDLLYPRYWESSYFCSSDPI